VCLIHKKLKTINAILTMSCLCNLSIYKASSAVNLTEALLWKGYYDRDKVIADRKEESIKGSYEGAYVKEPEVGIFRAATCFDYASLYPSIMRQFNVSPESFIEKTTDQNRLEKYRNDDNYIVSVTGAVYNKDLSVLKEILTNLYSKRKIYKNRHLDIERLLNKKKK
jgi:DNA polymerase elongation subunit (family B)